MTKHWTTELTPKDFCNRDLRLVAELCGVEVARSLMQNMPGLTIGIPTDAIKMTRENYIVKTYDGSVESIKRMSLFLKLSQRHVYRLIKRLQRRKRIKLYKRGK